MIQTEMSSIAQPSLSPVAVVSLKLLQLLPLQAESQ